MLGLGVLLWGTVLVSASPLQQVYNPETYTNTIPDYMQAVKELINSYKNTTYTESKTPESDQDSDLAFFIRSIVAAVNAGNNTQLDAILTELKNLNNQFKKYFKTDSCPEPFVSLGEECFNFQLEDLTWEESRQRCLQLGGDLAIPKDLTEVRLFIGQNYPRKSRRNFWLGGIENNKVWEWLSGEAVNSELWHVNEPSGNGDCLAMFDGWERPLSDFPCENQRRAICEHIVLN